MKQKILVVDDIETNRYMVKCMLVDFEVLDADSGSAMRKILTREIPDLILIDVMMPGENGFELARDLGADIQYSDIPIIFLTARDSGIDVEEGFSSGGADYIKKPYEEAELRARIKAVLAKKNTEQTLKLSSQLDSLTKLYNHGTFMELAARHLMQGNRDGKSVAIAILDIDFFKTVNDTFGHQAGDFILCNFSELLRNNMRRLDIVGRYGGEEFIILFYDCTRRHAGENIERVRLLAETAVNEFQGIKIRYTFSGGVADSSEIDKTDSLENLIRIADQRLYHAKKTGRNRIDCDDGS